METLRWGSAVACLAWLALACSADGAAGSERRASRAGSDGDDHFGNAASAMAAGTAGSGAATASFGNAASPIAASTAPQDLDGRECADALVQAAKSQPVVQLVIDGSGSMCADFGGQTRWQALREALLDPTDGLLYRLESGVEFGLHMYDGGIDQNLAAQVAGSSPACANAGRTGGCASQRVSIPTALDNAAAIDAAYPMVELGGSTPTDLALREVMEPMVASLPPSGPDTERQPHYVILATDGAPNSICDNGLGGDGSTQRQDVVQMAEWGASAGVKTYVISLAQDAALQSHLEEVAMVGGTGAAPFTPTNKDDLVDALAEIIGGAIGCDVFLNGEVTEGQECAGFVRVNGFELPCNDRDGWRLVNPGQVQLTGKACEDFRASPASILEAGFPCGVFTPF